ncbi:hypothetical protein CWC26_07090 [Pseudoalteromonas sp. S4488]|nr:hypothetical protein CWC26_07090 [Pseudoalteromonas sp. S4488]
MKHWAVNTMKVFIYWLIQNPNILAMILLAFLLLTAIIFIILCFNFSLALGLLYLVCEYAAIRFLLMPFISEVLRP